MVYKWEIHCSSRNEIMYYKEMSSKRRGLQTLVRSGIRGVQLVRTDPYGPVGKYIASIKINGQDLCGYDCCILCKELLKRGNNFARIAWAHKTRHLAKAEKFSNKELEERVRSFNNQPSSSRQEVAIGQIQNNPNKEPLVRLNFPNS